MLTGTTSGLTVTSDSKSFNDLVINGTFGLVGYWKLDETAEDSNSACNAAATFDDACDSSGFGHHGEWVITPVSSTNIAPVNYNNPASIDIDDGSLEFVDITVSDQFDLDVAGKYTWSVWINSDDLTAGSGWPTVWSQTVDTNNFFYFYAQTNASSGTAGGSITAGIAVWWNTSASQLVTEAENVLSVGSWYHVAVTYDGSLAQASRIQIYVDGVNVTGGTVSSSHVKFPGAISGKTSGNVRSQSSGSVRSGYTR